MFASLTRCFYTDEQLTSQLQTFERNNTVGKQLIRLFLLTVMLAMISGVIYAHGAFDLVRMATNWALIITSVYLALSILLHHVSANKNMPWHATMAVHHSLFTLGSSWNVTVVLIYWSLLHD